MSGVGWGGNGDGGGGGEPAGLTGRGHGQAKGSLAVAEPGPPCQPGGQWTPQSEAYHSTSTAPCLSCLVHCPAQSSACSNGSLSTAQCLSSLTNTRAVQHKIVNTNSRFMRCFCTMMQLLYLGEGHLLRAKLLMTLQGWNGQHHMAMSTCRLAVSPERKHSTYEK